MRAIWTLALLLGCNSGKEEVTQEGDVDTGTSAGGDTGGIIEPLSSFESGRYRAYYFQLLDDLGDAGEAQGLDLDGDDVIDNKLPSVLPMVVTISGNEALSLEGLNGSISDAMSADQLIMLMEAQHEGTELTLDVLLGAVGDGDSLAVDEASYGPDGSPQARLNGAFASEKRFVVSSDRIEIPVIFDAALPPVLLPLAMASIEGTMEEDAAQGTLGGAIPVDDLVSQVLEPLLPPEDEYDPEDYAGLERDALLDTVRDLGNESLADIELEDGSMAVSAALIFGADASDW